MESRGGIRLTMYVSLFDQKCVVGTCACLAPANAEQEGVMRNSCMVCMAAQAEHAIVKNLCSVCSEHLGIVTALLCAL